MRNIQRIFLFSKISRSSAFLIPLVHFHHWQNSFFFRPVLFSVNFKDTVYPADLSERFVHMKEQYSSSSSWLMQNKREISKQKVFTSYENVVMVCFPKDLSKRRAYFGQVFTENRKRCQLLRYLGLEGGKSGYWLMKEYKCHRLDMHSYSFSIPPGLQQARFLMCKDFISSILSVSHNLKAKLASWAG